MKKPKKAPAKKLKVIIVNIKQIEADDRLGNTYMVWLVDIISLVRTTNGVLLVIKHPFEENKFLRPTLMKRSLRFMSEPNRSVHVAVGREPLAGRGVVSGLLARMQDTASPPVRLRLLAVALVTGKLRKETRVLWRNSATQRPRNISRVEVHEV